METADFGMKTDMRTDYSEEPLLAYLALQADLAFDSDTLVQDTFFPCHVSRTRTLLEQRILSMQLQLCLSREETKIHRSWQLELQLLDGQEEYMWFPKMKDLKSLKD